MSSKRKFRKEISGKDKLLKECKAYRSDVRKSYKCRKLSEAQKEICEKCLTKRDGIPEYLPASNLRARYRLGSAVISLVGKLWGRFGDQEGWSAYFVTFIDDDFHFNERTGEADLARWKKKIVNAIKRRTTLDALIVAEVQAMTNFPKGNEGKMICLHAHAICFGKNAKEELKKLARSRAFKSVLTDKPVHFENIVNTREDFEYIGYYMMKPPFEAKSVLYKNLIKGKKSIRSCKPKKYHNFRIFEYGAKIPIERTIFSVGPGGAALRAKAVAQLKKWQKNIKTSNLDISTAIYPMFEDILDRNKKLSNYKPLKVII